MAKLILVEGPSSTGKTRSLLNLSPTKTLIINSDEKDLSFRGHKKNYPETIPGLDISDYSWANANNIYEPRLHVIIDKFKKKAGAFKNFDNVVIDTITNCMLKSVMVNINTKGFDKYVKFARELYDIIQLGKKLPCKYLILMAHVEYEENRERFKVPAGRFTSEKIVPESHFTTVLVSKIAKISENKHEYFFSTQSDGIDMAKSPEGMFKDTYIPNDMQYVIDCIEAYENDKEQPEPKDPLYISTEATSENAQDFDN